MATAGPVTIQPEQGKRKSKRRTKVARVLLLLLFAYVVIVLLVFFGQRNLLYFPDRQSFETSVEVAKRVGLEPWESGGKLLGWKKPSPAAGEHLRVLITHGNAGSAIDRVDYARPLNVGTNCDLYLLEYPGYGPLPGSPSQESFFRAADEAMAALQKEDPIWVIGESLGTGVAAYIAGTYPQRVAGILLVAPYHNLGEVAQAHMPLLPARWLLRDKFRSADYLRNYHGPVAVLLGGQDTTVPFRFGRKLFAAYHGPKRLWEVTTAGHNDLVNEPDAWWQELFAFWRSSTHYASSGTPK
jgi:uncharacterized protein